jgi:hypothetical protein
VAFTSAVRLVRIVVCVRGPDPLVWDFVPRQVPVLGRGVNLTNFPCRFGERTLSG